MDINITKLSDKEISKICIKYNIINTNDLNKCTREYAIQEIRTWCAYKKDTYRERRNSCPNIMNPTNSTNPTNTEGWTIESRNS